MRITLLLTALLLLTPALKAGERHFSKQFSVKPGETLILETDEGSVTITGTTSNEVSVEADIKGKTGDVDNFDITADQTPTGVTIKGKGRRSDAWFWNTYDVDVSYVVKVPREYNLRLNTAGGDLNVSNIAGKVKGETSGGNAGANDVQGQVDLSTSGGNIGVESITGDVKLVTSGGEISAKSITGGIDMWTSGGNIKVVDADGKVNAQTSGGDISVRLKNDNKGMYVETSGGNIRIAIGKHVPATIDASTSGGEVVCDIPVTVSGHIDESSIRGDLNGGGNTIRARTSGGDIRIVPVD